MSSDTLDLGERDPWISRNSSIREARWILAEAEDLDRTKKTVEQDFEFLSEEEELGGAVDRLIEQERFEEECEREGAQLVMKKVWCSLM